MPKLLPGHLRDASVILDRSPRRLIARAKSKDLRLLFPRPSSEHPAKNKHVLSTPCICLPSNIPQKSETHPPSLFRKKPVTILT
jgi:hypothetical protein